MRVQSALESVSSHSGEKQESSLSLSSGHMIELGPRRQAKEGTQEPHAAAKPLK